MTKSKIAIAATLCLIVGLLIIQRPAQTQKLPKQAPLATRDAATTIVNGNLANDPGVAILVGTRGSSDTGFRAHTLIGCDQFASKELRGRGEYGVASGTGRNLYVCSYSISNGSTAQDVAFIAGTEASSGSGHVCSPGSSVSGKLHLATNQFISQGSGIGSLFTTTSGQGLCLKVYGEGDVTVNVTYASF